MILHSDASDLFAPIAGLCGSKRQSAGATNFRFLKTNPPSASMMTELAKLKSREKLAPRIGPAIGKEAVKASNVRLRAGNSPGWGR